MSSLIKCQLLIIFFRNKIDQPPIQELFVTAVLRHVDEIFKKICNKFAILTPIHTKRLLVAAC